LIFSFGIKVRADVDAFVWDRANSKALSYKRCVSSEGTSYI